MSALNEQGHASDPWARPDDRYVTRPRWDIGRPQPALLALAEAGDLRGRVLDAGCGTGEHALMAARLGLEAVGIDLAASALEQAGEKARQRGLKVRFLRHDARRLAELGDQFDTVLDCGLFHIFREEKERTAYVDGLRSVVRPGGRYFMLGFRDGEPGDREPGHRGPRRLTREDVEVAFAQGWRIDSIEPTTLDSLTDPQGVPAWLVAATRIETAGTGNGEEAAATFSAGARVPTERASLRLTQVCRHASKVQDRAAGDHMPAAGGRHGPGRHGLGGHDRLEIRNVEWSDARGVIDAGGGRCTLTAEPDALVLHVEAADEEGLQRLQEMVAHRVETIGSRDGLKVRWEGQAPEPGPGPATSGIWGRLRRMVQHWQYRRAVGLGTGGGAVGWLVSMHTMERGGAVLHGGAVHLLPLALVGAAAVPLSRWLGWGLSVVVVLLAAAALLVVVARALGVQRLLLRRDRQGR